MKLKIIFTAAFCLIAGALAVSAQQKTDYSGSWTLDVSKSKLSERSPVESMTMDVTQTDNDISVDTKTVRKPRPEGEGRGGGMGRPGGGMGGGMMGGGDAKRTYTLDGKESDGGDISLKAKTEKDGKLKLTQSRNIETPMGSINVKTVETWQLTDEGKTLKVVRETETPRGSQTSEMIFTKN